MFAKPKVLPEKAVAVAPDEPEVAAVVSAVAAPQPVRGRPEIVVDRQAEAAISRAIRAAGG